MTPQERQLVAELFDRLSTLERTPRDGEAERAIADGLARAPHATYALVQTVLVQDEALKRANERIQDLESRSAADSPSDGGFLGSAREAIFGRREEARGSVPTVRGGDAPMGVPPGFGRGADQPPAVPSDETQTRGRGGSFLGTAAAAAAGVIGGALLLDGIRSMLGHQVGGQAHAQGALDAAGRSPGPSESSNNDLAHEAGLGDIGRSGGDSERSAGDNGYGLLDNLDAQEADFGDDNDIGLTDDADLGLDDDFL